MCPIELVILAAAVAVGLAYGTGFKHALQKYGLEDVDREIDQESGEL